MSGETARRESGWTIDTLKVLSDERLRSSERFLEERDRRYTELAVEREKALRIKETADNVALHLAREIQTYKDEKANELREQINGERGIYAQKSDLVAAIEKIEETIKPLSTYVGSQQGPRAITTGMIVSVLSAFAILGGLYLGFHTSGGPTPTTSTVTVTVPSK